MVTVYRVYFLTVGGLSAIFYRSEYRTIFGNGKTLEVGREGKLVFIYRANICLEVSK